MTSHNTMQKNIGRLKKRPDFLRVREAGRKWIAKGLIIEIAPTDNPYWSYGVTVTKKVSNSAVVRNRIKRRLRAVADEVLMDYASHPYDIVLIGRQSTENKEFDALKNDLIWCLNKLGIKKG